MAGEIGGDWTGLSPHLIARIYACDDKGVQEGDAVVIAPMVEGSLDITLNWQSPFEQMGPETKAPAAAAMLQSGMIVPLLNTLTKNNPNAAPDAQNALTRGAAGVVSTLNDLKGRTSITKLNSRQIFSGMPPIKIATTLHFRAWKNPQTEVEDPINQLIQWALPKSLFNTGIIESVVTSIDAGSSLLRALFPSESPQFVGVQYAGQVYAPLVIEHITMPMVTQRGQSGAQLANTIPITFGTLTAIDRKDWANGRIRYA